MHYTRSHPKHKGFSLIELLVTLAVLVVLLALGVPSFNGTLSAMRRDSAAKAFLSGVQLARTEAIKTSRTATMCVRKDATTCDTTTDWSKGWLIYTDSSKILVEQGALNGLTSMAGDKASLTFLPNGLMSSGISKVTVKSKSTGAKDLEITINSIGRASVAEK